MTGADSPHRPAARRPVAHIVEALEHRPGAWLVALVGIPGSGKSTLCRAIEERMPGAVTLPMDGYHLPRGRLAPDELRRRGAPHTFDHAALRADLRRLRQCRTGRFPAFDHARKDPEPEAVFVPESAPLVVVEGLYLLLADWDLAPMFDLTIYLDCPLEDAMERLVARHIDSGLASDRDEALECVRANDALNARTVLDDGCRERADLVIG